MHAAALYLNVTRTGNEFCQNFKDIIHHVVEDFDVLQIWQPPFMLDYLVRAEVCINIRWSTDVLAPHTHTHETSFQIV